jgi:hypothetical protein
MLAHAENNAWNICGVIPACMNGQLVVAGDFNAITGQLGMVFIHYHAVLTDQHLVADVICVIRLRLT